jgi:hypothetical protein
MKIPLLGFNVSTGALALGAVGIMVAPKVLPKVAEFLRTATKTSIKGGLIAYNKGCELVSGTADSFSDLASEAKSELSKAGAKPAPKKKPA